MFYRVICLFVLFILAVESPAQQSPEKLKVFPAPSWISYQTPEPGKIPEDQIQNGIYYLLVDRQIARRKAEPTQLYRHVSLQIANQNGLQDSATINVSYDPSYESVQWHHLQIIRDGKSLGRVQEASVNTLKRERQLEEAIYDGRLTLNIIIPDLRVGDVIDYSYSVIGQNPIYAGHFFDGEYLEWEIPLKHFHFQLDWFMPSDPVITTFNTTASPKLIPISGGSRYLLDVRDVAPKKSNTQVPSWYDPYARVYFSDFDNWSQVIEWGAPLYDAAIKTSPDIEKLVAQFQQASPATSKQASLALHYVQDNIRYLGVEIGKSSHQPSPAPDTLARRYGDCKDKAVLLVTLLRGLGIDAWPALVNTDLRQEVASFPPSINAFNHVIVLVRLNGKPYWLDPTRSAQKGDIEVLYQADYGYALVIQKGLQKLYEMVVPRHANQRVEEYLDASGNQDAPVSYEIHSQYTGYDAEVLRNSLRGNSVAERSESYLNFYKKFYDHIEISQAPTHEDDDLTGVIKVAEKYTIHRFWEEDTNASTATFYGNAVSSLIAKPDELTRVAPFELKEVEAKEILHIKLDDSTWNLANHRVEEKNPYFEFNRVVLFDKNKAELTLEFYFKTLAKSVSAADIPAYMEARKKVMDEVEYSLSITKPSGISKSDWPIFAWLTYVLLYLVALVTMLVSWARDKSKFNYLDESVFYPVSLPKFIVLSFATLGTYQLYWFYRNWSYIKQADKTDILPLARAIFSGIWAYALYKRMVEGHEAQTTNGLPKTAWGAALFAIAYLLASILSSKESGVVFITVFLLVSVLLAWHVLQIPQSNDLALKNNSRWLWRHTLLVFVGAPVVLLVYGQGLGFLPGGDIMEGKKLHGYDLRFMQRNKIVASDEPIIYFYSTAVLDMQDAGNGFTDKTVFAYWHGDDGALVVKNIPFTHIKDIVENKQGEHSLKIKGDQGEDFDIYLSSTASGNQKFISRLYQQWHSVRK